MMLKESSKIWWDASSMKAETERVKAFFEENQISGKLLSLYIENADDYETIHWMDDDVRDGEISRLRFGGEPNPEFRNWIVNCVEQIPKRSSYLLLSTQKVGSFFMEIQVQDLISLVFQLDGGNLRNLDIVDLASNQIFLIGTNGEYDSIFIKKHHPGITRENFVKVYDFLEDKILVPGDPSLDGID
jgi:hypothetical protein